MAQGTTLSWQLNGITKLLSFRGFNFENWQSCIPSSHQCWFISFVVKIVAVLLSYVLSALDPLFYFAEWQKCVSICLQLLKWMPRQTIFFVFSGTISLLVLRFTLVIYKYFMLLIILSYFTPEDSKSICSTGQAIFPATILSNNWFSLFITKLSYS